MSTARTAAHVDPRSPFVLDTKELGRRAGSMRRLERTLPAPADWQLELVRVPAGSPVGLDLRLEAVMEGVLVTGSARVSLEAECGRCLEPVTDSLVAPVQELFAYAPEPGDEEAPVLDGDFADLEPVLRDAVVLALPLNPVCDEACAGLCPGCGAPLAGLPAGHDHDAVDARWAALAGLSIDTDTDTQES